MFKRIDIATGKILGLVARNCAFLLVKLDRTE